MLFGRIMSQYLRDTVCIYEVLINANMKSIYVIIPNYFAVPLNLVAV